MTSTQTLAALTLTLALCAGTAGAQVSNGGFDAGLAGWNPAGDAVVQAGALALTTAYYAGGTDPDAPFNLSGQDAIYIDTLVALAGVSAKALDIGNEDAYEGSIVRQSFAVAAGDTLSFAWSFGTLDADFEDHAFAVIDGALVTLATRSSAPAGWQTYSHTWTQAGTATLAFGVADTGDYLGVTTLGIDDVQISAVPEPQSVLLMLGGIAGLAVATRRRASRA